MVISSARHKPQFHVASLKTRQTTLHVTPEISAKIPSNLLARVPERSPSLQAVAAAGCAHPARKGRHTVRKGRAHREEGQAHREGQAQRNREQPQPRLPGGTAISGCTAPRLCQEGSVLLLVSRK